MNLTPLKELEPTAGEIARVRELAAHAPPRRRRAPVLAVAAIAAAVTVATAIPGAETASTALRAAAAAAADQPAPAPFTGYRYVEVLDRRRDTWVTLDEECMRRNGLPRPATPGSDPSAPDPCPVTARVEYESEGRQELWVDANWQGTRRDHGSRVTSATGDPELAAAIRREHRREPVTDAYVYGEGPFARAPLAELPTDPDALLATLTAAFEDGRWAEGGRLEAAEGVRRFELARYVAHLLAEANATPALRAACFGVLARMEGVTDLGTIDDQRGREGHGVEVRGSARLRVIFDPREGEVLSWSEYHARGFVERVVLSAGHVATDGSPRTR